MLRLSSDASGSEKYIQSSMRLNRTRGQASGIRSHGLRSHPPASIRATLTFGSSVRRLASTQPAEPAPTMLGEDTTFRVGHRWCEGALFEHIIGAYYASINPAACRRGARVILTAVLAIVHRP